MTNYTASGVRIVEELTEWQQMDGDSDLEKKINFYLTKQFIGSKHLPADECQTEAKVILGFVLGSNPALFR